MSLQSALELLANRWLKEKVELLPPRDEPEVRLALTSAGIQVTSELLSLYSTTGGMEDGHMDENLFSLWPLPRVIEEFQKSPTTNLEFADFLIDSHRYAFRFYGSDGTSVWARWYSDEVADTELAPTVTDFFTAYASAENEKAAFTVLHDGVTQS